MPPPPHLQPGRNLYNSNGAAANANSASTVSFDKIKCGICKITKPTSDYAKRQQQRHALKHYNPYVPSGRSYGVYATCKECTARQVTDLHCVVCNLKKKVKYFNKTQRRDPDHARCKKCVQINEDRLASVDPSLIDSDDYTDSSGSEGDVDVSDDEPMNNKQLPPRPTMHAADTASDGEESEEDIDASDSEKKKASVARKSVSKQTSTRLTSAAATPSSVSTGASSMAWSKVAASPAQTGNTTPSEDSRSSRYSLKTTPPVNSGSNDEWQTVSSNRPTRKGNAFSSRPSAWNSGVQTPSFSASVKKGGWAKVPKLKKDEVPPFFQGSESPVSVRPQTLPAYIPTGGQPSMVNKKPRNANKKKMMEADSDDDYEV